MKSLREIRKFLRRLKEEGPMVTKVKVGLADDNKDFCEILTDFLRHSRISTLFSLPMMECKLLNQF